MYGVMGGGMRAIRSLFRVAETWDTEALGAGPRFLGGAMISLVRSGGSREGGVAGPAPSVAEDVARRPAASASRRSRNDEAIVLRVEYGLASFLLTSDIEAACEQALVAAGAPVAATVLKVAHHGSRSSTSAGFVDRARPALAVVSVGARNPYGHPDPGVLARLRAVGARVYRTDEDGAVIFETDGRGLTITRWATRATERLCLDPEAIC